MTTCGDAPRPRRATPPRSGDAWLAAGLLVLAGGLAAGTLLGPLLLDAVTYPFTDAVRNELVGLEAVTLLLVVPWAVVTAVGSVRGHPAAPLLALPVAGFAAYMLVQYVVGPQYATLRPQVLGHLALLVLSVLLLVRAWSAVDGSTLPPRSRGWVVVLAGLAAFVLARWLPTLTGTLSADPVPAARADLTMYWTIVMLDLALVVPLTVATAVALARRAPWAGAALYGVVGWFALVPPAVAAMAVVKLGRGDPGATPGDTVVLLLATLVGWAVAAVLYRPLLRPGGGRLPAQVSGAGTRRGVVTGSGDRRVGAGGPG